MLLMCINSVHTIFCCQVHTQLCCTSTTQSGTLVIFQLAFCGGELSCTHLILLIPLTIDSPIYSACVNSVALQLLVHMCVQHATTVLYTHAVIDT